MGEGTCYTHARARACLLASRTRARTHTHAADMQMSQLALPSARPFLFLFLFFTQPSRVVSLTCAQLADQPLPFLRVRFSSHPSIHPGFFSPSRSSSLRSLPHISPSGEKKTPRSWCQPRDAPWRLLRAGITTLLLFFRRHRFLFSCFPGLSWIPRAIFKKGEGREEKSRCHFRGHFGLRSRTHSRRDAGNDKEAIRFPATGQQTATTNKQTKPRIFFAARRHPWLP